MNTPLQPDAELTRRAPALAQALKQRDQNTGEHCDRTQALAIELGRAAGLSSSSLNTLGLAAQFHDVGKIGIPDAVLLKPGRLDPKEMEMMKTHPQRGHDILVAVPDEAISAIAQVVLHHHEAFAGGGYPGQLQGEAIPVLSRIIAIADSYDAMAESRPYHRAREHREIMRILREEDGAKYDQHLVAKFSLLIESSSHRSRGPLS